MCLKWCTSSRVWKGHRSGTEARTASHKSRVFLVSNTQNVWEVHGKVFYPVFQCHFGSRSISWRCVGVVPHTRVGSSTNLFSPGQCLGSRAVTHPRPLCFETRSRIFGKSCSPCLGSASLQVSSTPLPNSTSCCRKIPPTRETQTEPNGTNAWFVSKCFKPVSSCFVTRLWRRGGPWGTGHSQLGCHCSWRDTQSQLLPCKPPSCL